jgi:protein-S-isoprenylcysteine O-methyltransferase Ste14
MRTFAVSVVGFALVVAVIFWPAGTLDWAAGWIYVALITANMALTVAYVRRVNPELIARRLQIGEGTKHWDRIWSAIFRPLFVVIHVVAGLDAVRYEWSAMPAWLWPLGAMLFVGGMGLVMWSMGVNRFFETNVRIQTDRGHRVIDTGPYAIVRHPGYVGFLGWTFAVPLLLGSWWAFVPAAAAAVGLLIRTAMEDRTLADELTGYAEYSERVPFRLIPGVW